MESNEKLQNTFEKAAKWIVGIGAILGLISLIIFWSRYSFGWGNKVDAESTSQIVTAISGIITPLWSLASVILFYVALKVQRADFKAQLTELKETRSEFQISRSTNILFQQIERIDRHIERFELSNLKGYSAIKKLYLEIILTDTVLKLDINKPVDAENLFSAIKANIDFLADNFDSIEDLLLPISDNIFAVNNFLKNSQVKPPQKKELKKLLLDNLGTDLVGASRSIQNNIGKYHQLIEKGYDFGKEDYIVGSLETVSLEIMKIAN